MTEILVCSVIFAHAFGRRYEKTATPRSLTFVTLLLIKNFIAVLHKFEPDSKRSGVAGGRRTGRARLPVRGPHGWTCPQFSESEAAPVERGGRGRGDVAECSRELDKTAPTALTENLHPTG